jgi:hypothetical protein
MKTGQQAIEDATAEFSDLTDCGLNSAGKGNSRPIDPHQVETSIMFLQLVEPSNSNRESSYWLKHVAERWGKNANDCPYITNGAMFVAAHAIGFPLRRPNEKETMGRYNALIGVSKRNLENLREQIEKYEELELSKF